MKYTKISDTIQVSKVSFGCEPLGGTDWGDVNLSIITEAIEYALDKGVNFFDTADVYGLGLSEERLSVVLGKRRHDVVIATKGGISWHKVEGETRFQTKVNGSPDYIQEAIECSLKRLKIDQIPVYYIHWPDPQTDIRYTFERLELLKSQGKVNLIGCSNYTSTQLKQATEVAKLSLIQLPLNIIEKPIQEDIIKLCQKHNIKIVAYNVLAKGLLTGKFNELSSFPEHDRRSRLPCFQGQEFADALKKISCLKKQATEANLSLSQFAIDWVINQDFVASAITGIKNKDQIIKNIGSM